MHHLYRCRNRGKRGVYYLKPYSMLVDKLRQRGVLCAILSNADNRSVSPTEHVPTELVAKQGAFSQAVNVAYRLYCMY